MSKRFDLFLAVLLALGFAAIWPVAAAAQYIEAEVVVDAASRSAAVKGKFLSSGRRTLSFTLSAIGAPELGRRITGVELHGPDGGPIAFRSFNQAEYVAEKDLAGFRYKIALEPFRDPRSAAHASWIADDAGLLYLDDILPNPTAAGPRSASLTLHMPAGWTAVTTEAANSGVYRVENVERTVFTIGKGIRRAAVRGKRPGLDLALSGSWFFTDDEARETAAEIYREYLRIFGSGPDGEMLIVILPMPQPGVQKGTWEAESRGRTVVIASADMSFRSQSLQRLHEQLRHEMFHLWIPNGVSLTGRYDWFYEGFALYQSLRVGVAVNRIRFDDLLDTLSRAWSIDRSQTTRRSLIETSRQRWNGAETHLYARGMVVAFLCDLLLLQNSNGKASLEHLMARLYSAHRPPAAAADAGTSVLALLEKEPALAAVAAKYVRGAEAIDWADIIGAAGIEADAGPPRGLRVKPQLNRKQKALLDKLGYNNWRKLTRE